MAPPASDGISSPARASRSTGLRILMTEWRLTDDGAARSSLRLVSRWQAAGVRVRLFTLSRGGSRAQMPADVTPMYPTRNVRRLRYVIVPAALRLLRASLASDVVVAGREIGFGMLAGLLAARVTRRPFVVIVRSEPFAAIESYVPPRWQAINRGALLSADAVICISEGLTSALEAAGLHRDVIKVVLNGVEIDRITEAGARSPGALPPGEGPLVVGVGRIERQKGFDVLVRAHVRLMADGRPHRVLILGDGSERAALQALAVELGVQDSVHLPGFDPDPLPAIAAADVFCLPSRWEGFGQSLAEALLLGRPVIAADCVAGPRELLADGRHGDLVPVDDADALAAALRLHFDAPERLQHAAREGQEWARAHLDIDRTAIEMAEVLEGVRIRAKSRPLLRRRLRSGRTASN